MLAEFEECTYLKEGVCCLHEGKECKCDDFIPLIEWIRGFGVDAKEDTDAGSN